MAADSAVALEVVRADAATIALPRLWFANNLVTVSAIRNEQARGNAIAVLQRKFPARSGEYKICSTCKDSLVAGKVPPMSVTYGYRYPPKPDHLPPLNPVEERLIAPRLPFMSIRRLTHGSGQYGIKGRRKRTFERVSQSRHDQQRGETELPHRHQPPGPEIWLLSAGSHCASRNDDGGAVGISCEPNNTTFGNYGRLPDPPVPYRSWRRLFRQRGVDTDNASFRGGGGFRPCFGPWQRPSRLQCRPPPPWAARGSHCASRNDDGGAVGISCEPNNTTFGNYGRLPEPPVPYRSSRRLFRQRGVDRDNASFRGGGGFRPCFGDVKEHSNASHKAATTSSEARPSFLTATNRLDPEILFLSANHDQQIFGGGCSRAPADAFLEPVQVPRYFESQDEDHPERRVDDYNAYEESHCTSRNDSGGAIGTSCEPNNSLFGNYGSFPCHLCHTAAGGDRFDCGASTEATRRAVEAAASVRASVLGPGHRGCSVDRPHRGPFAVIRRNAAHSTGVELQRRHPFSSKKDAAAGAAFITDVILAVRATG
ncbi:hypothetical protein HPB49_001953 [Dermacentor silvarum]|uniref:Uncharacterized protein n=1 Tax=Dermacentor silvarum TaxID=543639 RepID=A0ACB8CUM6_DERSI|nr:hypothetical protein HPB49_001953 [Dermacentor silvarum]